MSSLRMARRQARAARAEAEARRLPKLAVARGDAAFYFQVIHVVATQIWKRAQPTPTTPLPG